MSIFSKIVLIAFVLINNFTYAHKFLLNSNSDTTSISIVSIESEKSSYIIVPYSKIEELRVQFNKDSLLEYNFTQIYYDLINLDLLKNILIDISNNTFPTSSNSNIYYNETMYSVDIENERILDKIYVSIDIDDLFVFFGIKVSILWGRPKLNQKLIDSNFND